MIPYLKRVRGYITDFHHAARTLLKARAFTAVCVTSLGLGMGVVIAILLLVRMVFATPPGVGSDGLVELVIRPSGALRAPRPAAPSSIAGRMPTISTCAAPRPAWQ